MIPYGRQDINQADIDAVVDVLKSDFLTQGPAIPAFEKKLADYCSAAHAVAVNSATAALHIACLALGAGPGDMIWTSPNTFPASSNVGLLCGAAVDFVDIDPQTFNMCPRQLEQKLQAARITGKLPKIVIPVHFAGQSCDMAAIARLGKEYGFAILEDASHCIGGDYQQRKIGCCAYSDACVFSFHPVKIITTGEGGMVTTNDPVLFGKMAMLRTHGITRDEKLFRKPTDGAWYYEQQLLAPNYRMTDMQAALGASQMTRLDGFITRRRALAARYDRLFENLPHIRPIQLPETDSAWHLYVIQLPDGFDRRAVFDALRAKGIGVNVHYIPVHTHPYYQGLGFKAGDFPVAEAYYARCITLPLYSGLTDAEQDYIVATVTTLLAA